MVNDRLHQLKTGAIDETRKLFGIFIYFWVLLSLFSFHKALVLNEENLIYHQGFALLNALALAKVVLVGEIFRVGDNLENRPLIYPIMAKSAIFAVILICFHIIEETSIGLLHGKTFLQSIPDIGGGKLQGILMIGIIMFVVLLPFFAFGEFERAVGEQELRILLFGDTTKEDATLFLGRPRWGMATAAAAAAILALAGGWLAWSSHQNRTARYLTQKLERGSVVRTVTVKGIIGPAAFAPVATRVSGVIQALDCDAKMKVTAGQLCAKIDPRPYQIMIDRAKSGLAGAEARVEKDKTDLAEAKAVYENHAALAERRGSSQKVIGKSRRIYEDAQARMKRDEARVAELQAALHVAETNLNATDIVAPVGGTVVSRNVEIGQTATVGSAPPLFLIAPDLIVIHAGASVSEKDIGEIKPGNEAALIVESLADRPFTGEVARIEQSPQSDGHAASYDVVIRASNLDLMAEPGMAAILRITTGRRDGVRRAPNKALHSSGDLAVGSEDGPTAAPAGWSRLWVLRGGEPAAIAVQPGLDDGNYTEIINGDVQPGDDLIIGESDGFLATPPEHRPALSQGKP